MKETGLEKAYLVVVKLCTLVLTMPATNASEEQSVSMLKQLSNISLLIIENNLTSYISENARFYNKVIEKKMMIELQYK